MLSLRYIVNLASVFEIDPFFKRLQFRNQFVGPNEPKPFGSPLPMEQKGPVLRDREFVKWEELGRAAVGCRRWKQRVDNRRLLGRGRSLVQYVQKAKLWAAKGQPNSLVCLEDGSLGYLRDITRRFAVTE